MQKLIQFVKDAIRELKNVTWPGKKEIVASTVIVVLVTLLLMITLELLISSWRSL